MNSSSFSPAMNSSRSADICTHVIETHPGIECEPVRLNHIVSIMFITGLCFDTVRVYVDQTQSDVIDAVISSYYAYEGHRGVLENFKEMILMSVADDLRSGRREFFDQKPAPPAYTSATHVPQYTPPTFQAPVFPVPYMTQQYVASPYMQHAQNAMQRDQNVATAYVQPVQKALPVPAVRVPVEQRAAPVRRGGLKPLDMSRVKLIKTFVVSEYTVNVYQSLRDFGITNYIIDVDHSIPAEKYRFSMCANDLKKVAETGNCTTDSGNCSLCVETNAQHTTTCTWKSGQDVKPVIRQFPNGIFKLFARGSYTAITGERC